MANVLRVHGPLVCERTCSACDGEHHWLDECVQSEDRDEDVCEDVENMPPTGDPYLHCKHCRAWSEYPDWWGDDTEFVAVDVRQKCGATFELDNGETVTPCDLPQGHVGQHEGRCLGSLAVWTSDKQRDSEEDGRREHATTNPPRREEQTMIDPKVIDELEERCGKTELGPVTIRAATLRSLIAAEQRVAELEAELASERERAAGLVAALFAMVNDYDGEDDVGKGLILSHAVQALSASGFEVVKGWFDPHADGEWWVHESKPTTGYYPCYLVTMKGADNENG